VKPACMDDAEYALWSAANATIKPRHAQARRPCSDCPLSFFQEMTAVGRCDGMPQMRMPGPMSPARLRAQWSAAQMRRRERLKLAAVG
jgi:hypothetical protein